MFIMRDLDIVGKDMKYVGSEQLTDMSNIKISYKTYMPIQTSFIRIIRQF